MDGISAVLLWVIVVFAILAYVANEVHRFIRWKLKKPFSDQEKVEYKLASIEHSIWILGAIILFQLI